VLPQVSSCQFGQQLTKLNAAAAPFPPVENTAYMRNPFFTLEHPFEYKKLIMKREHLIDILRKVPLEHVIEAIMTSQHLHLYHNERCDVHEPCHEKYRLR